MRTAPILLLGLCLLHAAVAQDLLELGCITDAQCDKYEHARCLESRCICTAHGSKNHTECQPKDEKLSNIIGGPCPCSQQGSECDAKLQQCFCAADHVPSIDKRRCLPQQVSLGGHCELSRQCQLADTFAVCHTSNKICMCKEHFEPHEGQCLALLDLSCSNHTYCESIGASLCLPQAKKCVCDSNSVPNPHMTSCMSGAAYDASCETPAQCQLQLGAGATCRNNRCSCRHKYYAKTKRDQDEMANSTTCEPIVHYGAYCRHNEDCQQMELEPMVNSSMLCRWGECRCQPTHRVVDNAVCVLTSGAGLSQLKGLLPMLHFALIGLLYACI